VTHAQVARAAETALRLDPGLGGAYQALGYLKPLACFEERGALHQKALAVSPNDPTVLTNASFFFAETGRLEVALRFARRAYEIDPMNPWAANWYASTLDYTGRLDEGRVLWDGFRKLWPDNRLILENCIGEAAARPDWAWFDELVAAAGARHFDNPGLSRAINYGNSLRECGPDDRAGVLQRLGETLRTTGTLRNSSYMLLSRLGLVDEAFELIGEASFAYVSDPNAPTPNGRTDDGLIFAVSHNNVMMRDVRFVGFCDRLGLCDYWVKTGNWPDCAEAVAPYYDFKAEARRLVAA
jgi:tetratricopeptide (TPR) repeat protein